MPGDTARIVRREFHPDAPRLGQLTDDPLAFGVGDLDPVTDAEPWRDAERLWDRLLTGGARAPGFRLVRDGTTLPRSECCRPAPIGHGQVDDLAEPNRILEQFAAGATVVLQGLQFNDPVFAKLSTNLALELDHPVQVNAYLSPPAVRGLDLHFDFHDVVVVQLAGIKRWRVWRPIPRSERALKRGPAIRQPTLAELDSPIADIVLKPGECLTIPRGHPHAAETAGEESAHLTIGVMALTWNRLLRDRIDDVASGTDLAERLAIAGFDRSSYDADPALAALRAALDPQEIARAAAPAVWKRQPQTRLRPRRPPELSPSDPIRVTPGPLLWLDPEPRRRGDPARPAKATLFLGDRRLRLPPDCVPLVTAVLTSTGVFTAGALEGDLDDESRCVVINRLALEGVIARA